MHCTSQFPKFSLVRWASVFCTQFHVYVFFDLRVEICPRRVADENTLGVDVVVRGRNRQDSFECFDRWSRCKCFFARTRLCWQATNLDLFLATPAPLFLSTSTQRTLMGVTSVFPALLNGHFVIHFHLVVILNFFYSRSRNCFRAKLVSCHIIPCFGARHVGDLFWW